MNLFSAMFLDNYKTVNIISLVGLHAKGYQLPIEHVSSVLNYAILWRIFGTQKRKKKKKRG